uniref:Tail-collar fiber protein n=1 Tax=Caudovirales sp. ctTVN2 TaxID=2827634 RepID=A0A8S5S922_9CAUD|nr:MAG TPA: tail-collar fiber protein [Caudovirales sp. ctTVN2]
MSWNTSAYTQLGVAMLTEAMAGKRMTFTRAVGGAGTVAADDLPKATAVTDQRQTLILADSAADKEGDDTVYRLKVQISNKGLEQGYTLHQIGIYAKLDDSSSDALVCIFQDDHGFEIVPEAAMSNLLLEFYGMVVISGTAQVTVTADPAAIATEAWVRKLLAEHDKNPEAHKELFAAITAANISFDGPAAGLKADSVQAAVKEMVDKIDGIKESLTAENIAFEDTAGTGATNLQDALDAVLGNTLPKLTVTTTAGSALTLTDGKSTITGTADSGGSYTVALPRMGLWTVTAKLAGLTTDDTIDVETVGGKYTLTLPYFAATLTVTAAPGATVTAALPTGKAYTATADDTGTVQVKLKRSGTYTVSAHKDDAESDTAAVSVTENGGAYTATVHFCRLVLTAPIGSAITASCGDATLTATITGSDETGSVTLYPPTLGSWTITATKGDDSTSEAINATEYKDYTLTLDYVNPVLDKNEWKVIKKVADADKGANYWAVGDTKRITLNGKVGATTISNLKVDAFIIGFNHNSGKEGSNRIHFLLGKIGGKFVGLVDSYYDPSGYATTSGAFTMNTSDTNSGGWAKTQMRSTVLGAASDPTNPTANTLLAALPADLRAVMKSVTKYTDNTGGGSNSASAVTATTDYLWLLAEFEVFGSRTYANSSEPSSQAQYEYFKAGNSKIAYKHSAAETAAAWRLRSPYYTNNYRFCAVDSGGGAYYYSANRSLALVPGVAA